MQAPLPRPQGTTGAQRGSQGEAKGQRGGKVRGGCRKDGAEGHQAEHAKLGVGQGGPGDLGAVALVQGQGDGQHADGEAQGDAIIFLANLVLGVVMSLTADIGTEHGLSFAVYLRAPFGLKGTHLPAVSRGVVAAIWFGVQTYLGALALNGIVEYLWGLDNWILWYVLFAVVQIVNTALGIRAVELLASIAAPCIVAISVWMYFTLDVLAETQGINIWTFVGDQNVAALGLFFANMAFWSALAVDIPNLTRFLKTKGGERSFFQRNKNVFVAQFLALPATQAWIALIGGVSFIAAGDWNPVTVIQGQGGGLTLIALLAMVILAQWSTNNAANLIPAALTFVNAGAPRVSYPVALVIAGIIGTASMPWLILNNLFTFLSYYGAVLSAVGGGRWAASWWPTTTCCVGVASTFRRCTIPTASSASAAASTPPASSPGSSAVAWR